MVRQASRPTARPERKPLDTPERETRTGGTRSRSHINERRSSLARRSPRARSRHTKHANQLRSAFQRPKQHPNQLTAAFSTLPTRNQVQSATTNAKPAREQSSLAPAGLISPPLPFGTSFCGSLSLPRSTQHLITANPAAPLARRFRATRSHRSAPLVRMPASRVCAPPPHQRCDFRQVLRGWHSALVRFVAVALSSTASVSASLIAALPLFARHVSARMWQAHARRLDSWLILGCRT